ncbi:MAG: hypothetical protein WD992_02955 [Candidatus Levyibacteriota bacterium]
MTSLVGLVNRIGRNNLIALLAIILLLLAGIFLLLSGKTPIKLDQQSQVTPTVTPIPTTVPGETIMLTSTRAVPVRLTLKKGHLVNFVNFSGIRVEIVGLDDFSKDLSIGILEDSATSNEILLKNPGTYKYYDKLNPKITGEIIVVN